MIGTSLEELRCIVEDALDELCSPRSSSVVRTKALDQLEMQLASACLAGGEGNESWDHFMAIQYTFECNIPLRLIGWITTATRRLEHVFSLSKTSNDEEICLSSQLMKALGIIQGIALSHQSSKVFLGRKYSLEVLLDLLLTSRHMTPATTNEEDSKPSIQLPPPLSSMVMDTLLCVLVDSSKAIRSFESAHGIQAIVKILKRAGTPREVRMKCLEFIYFYLLDETVPTEAIQNPRSPCASPPPSTPVRAPRTLSQGRLSKPSLNPTPLRPLARHGSASSSEFSTSSNSSGSRSTSGSSMNSFTSMSSLSTPTSSIPSSPEKPKSARHTQALSLISQIKGPLPRTQTPFLKSSPFPSKFPQTPKPLARPGANHGSGNGNNVATNMMMMLKKDVEYEPLSPKKSGFSSRDRVSTPYHSRVDSTSSSVSRPRAQTHGQLYTPSRNFASSTSTSTSMSMSMSSIPDGGENDDQNKDRKKTTEEKKVLLGTMLGNVDVLVEGVRKAGIWGLA